MSKLFIEFFLSKICTKCISFFKDSLDIFIHDNWLTKCHINFWDNLKEVALFSALGAVVNLSTMYICHTMS